LRFKCSTCPDYDLCEACNTKGVHAETKHSLEKITRPKMIYAAPKVVAKPDAFTPEPVEQKGLQAPLQPEVVPALKLIPVVPKAESPKSSPVVEKKVQPAPVPVPVKVEAPQVQKIETPKVESPKVEVKNEAPKQLTPLEAKLVQLEEMGFADKIQNINILIKNNGDMLNTVKDLLGGN